MIPILSGSFDASPYLDGLIDEYYRLMGYTKDGIPTEEKLRELGLDGVIKDIEQSGIQ